MRIAYASSYLLVALEDFYDVSKQSSYKEILRRRQCVKFCLFKENEGEILFLFPSGEANAHAALRYLKKENMSRESFQGAGYFYPETSEAGIEFDSDTCYREFGHCGPPDEAAGERVKNALVEEEFFIHF